ncbi:hypothetical protein LTR37_008044 [Vermiconidia calcicola]|uniref:Uncharacterized protein n=1 Tax=Vermiconidia calcicola TaxID=1690605 RepID=A0ACC3NCT0_9PEZI|nr:hypothetical protein LTR37_008044 [Vermiconidia calcicola]
MGLPQQQQSTMDAQPHTNHPKDASELPPEALDLATKLFNFAREGKTSELQQYISAGIPVNLVNHKGDTLLMLASYHGHLETTNMLLSNGADPNMLNERGQSCIAGAVFKGDDEIVKAILEKGADLRAGQPNAIDSAKMFKREECLRMFGVENET